MLINSLRQNVADILSGTPPNNLARELMFSDYFYSHLYQQFLQIYSVQFTLCSHYHLVINFVCLKHRILESYRESIIIFSKAFCNNYNKGKKNVTFKRHRDFFSYDVKQLKY